MLSASHLHERRGAGEFVRQSATLAAARMAAFIAPAFAEDAFHLKLSLKQFLKSIAHADGTTWTSAHLRGNATITAITDPLLTEAGPLAVEGVGLAYPRRAAFNVTVFLMLSSDAGD